MTKLDKAIRTYMKGFGCRKVVSLRTGDGNYLAVTGLAAGVRLIGQCNDGAGRCTFYGIIAKKAALPDGWRPYRGSDFDLWTSCWQDYVAERFGVYADQLL